MPYPVPCRRIVSFFFFAVSLQFSAHSAFAQSPDALLKRATKALGGEKALRAVKSRAVKGSLTRITDGSSGSYTSASMRPGLFTSSIDIRGFEVDYGFNGKSGWTRDSRDGMRTLTGLPSRDFQTEAGYHNSLWLDYKKEKSKVTACPNESIEGKPARCVSLITSRNSQIKVLLDSTSFLPLREEFGAGDHLRTFSYSDYRPVNGVMEAYAIGFTAGSNRYQIKLGEVIHNSQLTQTLFDFPVVSSEPLPDIPTLIKQVGDNEEAIDKLLENYTYTELVTARVFDKSGKYTEKSNETYERTFYKRFPIRRLVAKNGKALTPEEQEKEDKRVEKRIRDLDKKESEREKKTQAREAKEAEKKDAAANAPNDDDNDERLSIADILRASNLLNPRRERFRNRDVIVFDFEPNRAYKPQKDYEKLFGKMAGVLWVDAADRQVGRLEARLVESFKIGGGLLASLKEGASFVIEQDRINNEIWLPTRADISLSVRVLLLKNIDAFQTVDFSNYKRFNVDAEKEKLQSPVTKDNKPE
jgi:hypothetical protein